jgi:Protein of unknown function (DUF3631)
MSNLVRRPIKVDNITPAALFRCIDKYHPTLLIDEVDTFIKQNENLRGILNSAHIRSGGVIRLVGDKHDVKRFSTFGAIVLCGIGGLKKTLKSRSITLELKRKQRGEVVENLRHVSSGEIGELKSRLLRFTEDVFDAVKQSRPEVPGLENRSQDNWEPLLSIADAAGGDWSKRVRDAAMMISKNDADNDFPGIEIELLSDVKKIFEQQNCEKIFTDGLIFELCQIDESRWVSFDYGRTITARQLSSKLRSFKIKSKSIRIDTAVRRGYQKQDFLDAFNRYLPEPDNITATMLQA